LRCIGCAALLRNGRVDTLELLGITSRRMRRPVNGRWRGSGQSSGSRRPTEPCRCRR
jgi:hypothetical protein